MARTPDCLDVGQDLRSSTRVVLDIYRIWKMCFSLIKSIILNIRTTYRLEIVVNASVALAAFATFKGFWPSEPVASADLLKYMIPIN